jgi:hypothetical protein
LDQGVKVNFDAGTITEHEIDASVIKIDFDALVQGTLIRGRPSRGSKSINMEPQGFQVEQERVGDA